MAISRFVGPRCGATRLAAAVAAAVAFARPPAALGQADFSQRVVPENSVIRPGIDTVGYPEVGRAQRGAIAREAFGSTFIALAREPLRSSAMISGRAGERLLVRARALTVGLGSARPSPCRPWEDCEVFGAYGTPPMAATLTLSPTSEASVRGLLDAVAAARRRVDLMIFGWEDDPTGREVAGALEAAARRGVVVRLAVDRGGFLIHNRAAAEGPATFLDRLRRVPDVRVIEPADTLLRLDHRKLAVIDGRLAWSGGMILTEVARRRWENLAYLVEGPPARHLQAVFEERWREIGGPPGELFDSSLEALSDDPAPNATVRVVRTDVRDRSLRDAVYRAVDRARHNVYLENPYFTDQVLAAKLTGARRRGADVRVVMTLRGNVERLNHEEVLVANRLRRGGVRVYLAPGMTHRKVLSADGAWCYLGTGNFDDLSLRNNRELGLSVQSREVTGRLDATVFLPDMAKAEELKALMPLPDHWPLRHWLAPWY